MARRDDRNSLGGFHHGSGAIAPIKKPDIWLQYLSAIFKKKHLVYWERPYTAAKSALEQEATRAGSIRPTAAGGDCE
ncbi:hypothetical protein XM56_04395 [Yersinia enterocolitica]|nr:hypothetical protein XM56_04395 [Yersinia enterocolitica]